MGQQSASGVAALIYLGAMLIVLCRAGIICRARSGANLIRSGTWFLVIAMTLGALPNLVSQSRWENLIFGPLALGLAALCFAVAGGRGPLSPMAAAARGTGIDLYWLPLGADGHSVRWNGRVFEAGAALLGGRERCDLYHSALQVYVPEGLFVIEQAPAWGEGSRRGVVAEGAVGVRVLGRFRLFRYEVRRWREGVSPDIDEAVESPLRLSDNPDCTRRLFELVPQVPTPVWGRDELDAGEMWNSNSTISWLLARSGLDVASIALPRGGRAPGWHAGIVVAGRHHADAADESQDPRHPSQVGSDGQR